MAIITKIKKLLALSSSSNEHEAAQALRVAQELMAKYNVTSSDVIAADVGEASAAAGAKDRPAAWEATLPDGVAGVFGCDVIFSNLPAGQGCWLFIGLGPNPVIAQYAFETLFHQLKSSRSKHIKKYLQRVKRSTKTRRADLYCQVWVGVALEKTAKLVRTTTQEEAITAFKKIRFGDSLTDCETANRNRKRELSPKDFISVLAGRLDGKNAILNPGVADLADQKLISTI